MPEALPLPCHRAFWLDALKAGWLFQYLYAIANDELDESLRGRVSPSDVVQETLLRAHASLDDFRGDTEAEFRGWLATAARRQALNARRHERQTAARSVGRETPLEHCPAAGPLATRETPSDLVRRQEERDRLAAAVRLLSPDAQQVVYLHAEEGLTFGQVGAAVGCSEDAARMRYARALEQIRRLLGLPAK